MYEDIRRNKIKTGLIVFLFVLAVTLIIYYICMAFDLGPFSIVIAFSFSVIAAFASYYSSDKIILAVSGARPASEEENRKLINILDGLVVSSGMEHKPRLYIQDDPQPNAFATGRNPQNSIICVTTGLLDKMDYYELEAVVAHELGHIKNYDILLSAVVSVMVGLIVMLSDLFTRTFLFRGNRKNDNDKSSGIMMLVGVILLIISPIFAKLMQLAISRKREFLADATSVQLTRNPDGMISALEKLGGDRNELRSANKATSAMYISEPFRKKKNNSSWFSTHPSIEDRIDAIRNLR